MVWTAPEPLGPPDFPTLGWQVIDWIEAHLCHGPGDVAGEPIVLDDEMANFVCHVYRLDADGRRVYRRAVLSRPKGRAKSEVAGMLVCAELLGPVRFDGWDAAGEPVGRPVTWPFIRCLATEETQSGNTYDNVRFMLGHAIERGGREFRNVDTGLTRVYVRDDRGQPVGEVRPSSASASAKDGGKETFAVADETHLYALPELVGMHRTVMRNLAKRRAAEPWMLDTTTMFAPGEGSIAEQSMDRRSADVLIDHRQALRPVEDLNDDVALRAGLLDAYGDAAGWMDLDRIMAEMRDPSETEASARRYFLNQRWDVADAYIAPDDWSACADATKGLQDGDLVVLGFDGATADDATALVACRVEDGHIETLGVWQPGDRETVDREAVDAAIRAAYDRFSVWRLYADPPHWQDYLDRWAADLGQGDTGQVVEWWTNRRTAMGHALERFATAVQSRGLTHDGDSTLTAHVIAARRRTVSGHLQIGKEHRKSRHKIDACVASVLAWEARAVAIAAGGTA